jgi:hypothetical protein
VVLRAANQNFYDCRGNHTLIFATGLTAFAMTVVVVTHLQRLLAALHSPKLGK